MNDCTNHNCSNQSKLHDMWGIHVRQQKTCTVCMCSSKKHVWQLSHEHVRQENQEQVQQVRLGKVRLG
jgi:hypothetical protein